VRKLPSGRFQAHYRIYYKRYVAPHTFRTRREAESFLAATRTDLQRGTWVNPDAGKTTLREYAAEWLAQRPIRPRTRELYKGLLRLHLLPALGELELSQVTSLRVRWWHADHAAAGLGASSLAKSYRLLHAIFETAVQDDIVIKNPCVLRGAGVERPVERPIATIEQVFDLADAVEESLGAMVLLATFTGLRLGELRALRRGRVDLLHRRLVVVEQLQQLKDGTTVVGPPKSDAGRRTVAIPDAIIPDLERHLARFGAPGPDGLVFTGTMGQPVRLATFYASWQRATRAVGLAGFHFHDLRHTGNTMAAATGASTKELMSRMGHSSPRAALIYQHATQDRDAEIAASLSTVIESAVLSRSSRAVSALRDLRPLADP
jgi:integrase